MRIVQMLAVLAWAGLLSACGSIPLPQKPDGPSEPEAIALLEAAQVAHGKQAFAAIRDISVAYDGDWLGLITRIQPAITDPSYRKTSEERMLIRSGKTELVSQIHSGSAGKKTVLEVERRPSVWYNGQAHTERGQLAASHLVVHAYQLFLYPAFYVQRASVLERAGTAVVDGRDTDKLMAVLRPGFGGSAEDRAILFIDRQDKLVRRVWLTLEGTEPSKGAVVGVDYRAYADVGGVRWPVKMYETVVRPFAGLPAHDFWVTGLELNRGLERSDFEGGVWSDKAARPAQALPKSQP
jgi:hypothetical protein